MHNDITVMLDTAARKAYEQLEMDLLLQVDETTITAGSAGVLTGKLLQLCNGAVYDTEQNAVHIHDCKLNAFIELIEQLNGPHALVFFNFQHDRDRLNLQLDGHHAIWFSLTWSFELNVDAMLTAYHTICMSLAEQTKRTAGTCCACAISLTSGSQLTALQAKSVLIGALTSAKPTVRWRTWPCCYSALRIGAWKPQKVAKVENRCHPVFSSRKKFCLRNSARHSVFMTTQATRKDSL